jgi:DNA primase
VGVKKSETLFGIERFKGGTAVLLESPLDVVRLTSVGSEFQGLASFGAAISDNQINMLEQYADRLIVAMDNDEAGLKASQKLFSSLPRFRKGVLWLNYDGTDAKDIGDMTNEQIAHSISTSSAIPKWFK